jgi:hypothetical protein
MSTRVPPELHAFVEGEERVYECTCCGSPIHRGNGEIHSSHAVLADYWYEWPDGHEGQFSLAVCLRDEAGEWVEGAGVVVLRGSFGDENLQFAVVDGALSPWKDFGVFGPVLTRSVFLASPSRDEAFQIVDAVVARDIRLVERIEKFVGRRSGEI